MLPPELDLDALLRMEYPDDLPLMLVTEALARAPDIVRLMSAAPGLRLEIIFLDGGGMPMSPDTPLVAFRNLSRGHGARVSINLKPLR